MFFAKDRWYIRPAYQNSNIAKKFKSTQQVFDFEEGEKISYNSHNATYRVKIEDTVFYIKYYMSSPGLRSWLKYDRIYCEWHNLLFFQEISIPTLPLVAHGSITYLGKVIRGVIITEEIPNSMDLKTMLLQHHPLLKNHAWVTSIVKQTAYHTRIMHQQRFTHNDLKWRNLLVTLDATDPTVFFFDCPQGQKWCWPLLAIRKRKDLACLDKVACQNLSRTMRLRFYKIYRNINKLLPEDKKNIYKIVRYFKR